VRRPRQERTRAAWGRILDAAVEVLTELGVSRFNVTAVCERAGVAATAVYARVDTREDLLRAAYDLGSGRLLEHEATLAAEVRGPDPAAAVNLMVQMFAEHGAFLRAIVLGANEDDYLAARGHENMVAARERFVRVAVGPDHTPRQRVRAEALFRVTFSTLTFETAFGVHLLRGSPPGSIPAELALIARALFDPAEEEQNRREPYGL
jgi:AcrR family transcriptional regulator